MFFYSYVHEQLQDSPALLTLMTNLSILDKFVIYLDTFESFYCFVIERMDLDPQKRSIFIESFF
jgi:hypothetical protein